MTAAYELDKKGYDIKLKEASDTTGGRMATRYTEGLAFDVGANFLVSGYQYLLELCRELEIEEDFVCIAKSNVLMARHGKLHRNGIDATSPLGILMNLMDFTSLKKIDRVKLLHLFLRIYLHSKSAKLPPLGELRSGPLDSISFYDFCVKYGGREVAEIIMDAAVSTCQFHGAKDISAQVYVNLLGQIMSNPEQYKLSITRQGIGQIGREITKRLAQSQMLELNSPVHSIARAGSQLFVNGQEVELYDAVVVAVPAPVAARILPDDMVDQKRFLGSVEYASTINFAFKVPLEMIQDIQYVAVSKRESEIIAELTGEHNKGENYIDGGDTVMTVGLHHEAAKSLLDDPDQAIAELVLQNLELIIPQWAGYMSQVSLLDLQRHKLAMPVFKPGYLGQLEELRQSNADSNIKLVGDHVGLWTEGAARSGREAAEEIHQYLSSA